MSDAGRLSASLSGYVLDPSSPGYAASLVIDNGRVDLLPAYVVLPRSTNDVVLATRFARDRDLPLTVKCGGHSAAGYCLNRGGVVLDLSMLKEIVVDADAMTARVQLGCRWQDVYDFLIATGTGLLPVGGGCLTVGLGGFLLGGGYSFASRSYGMGCDNVLSLDLVTPDGTLHHLHDSVTSDLDKELWWACRGGGGGNFGVAVEVVLRLHQPPNPTMTMAELIYPLGNAHDDIGAYNEWAPSLPNAMAAYGMLNRLPDPAESNRLVPAFQVTAIYNGPHAEAIELLRPMLDRPSMTAATYDMPLPVWEDRVGTTTLVGDKQAYIRSGIMRPGGMTSDVVDVYQRFMGDAPSPDSFVVWTHGGGAIEDVTPDSTAVAHRDGGYIYELKSIWTEIADARANVEWAYHFGEALRPHFVGSYVNYIDPLLTDWARMYYGDHYDRLLRVKSLVDPDGFFRFQQGVGSPFEPSGDEPLDLSPLNRTVVPGEVVP